jgi:hypothetical protein
LISASVLNYRNVVFDRAFSQVAATITVDHVREKVLGTMAADGWRVQVVETGRSQHWYRVTDPAGQVHDGLAVATVQRLLGDAYADLQPVEDAA